MLDDIMVRLIYLWTRDMKAPPDKVTANYVRNHLWTFHQDAIYSDTEREQMARQVVSEWRQKLCSLCGAPATRDGLCAACHDAERGEVVEEDCPY